MTGMPRTYLPAGGATLLGTADTVGPFLRERINVRFGAVAEKVYLSSRTIAFDVYPIGARPNVQSAVYAFAYRYGLGWHVLYVGSTTDNVATRMSGHHKINTAIGYGATHLLVRPTSRVSVLADEAWLIADLKPPLNEIGLGGWR
jgi:hypothetical protein